MIVMPVGVGFGYRSNSYWILHIFNILIEYWFVIVILALIYGVGKRTTGGLCSGELPEIRQTIGVL